MAYSDQDLELAAIRRVSRLFGIEPSELSLDAVFGEDLQASFISIGKDNELDELLFDIQFVADRQAKREINREELVIRTVSDYCKFMIRSYHSRPKAVVETLFSSE